MMPATTKSPPALFGQVSRAPKKRAARTITSATLSLSMGATRVRGAGLQRARRSCRSHGDPGQIGGRRLGRECSGYPDLRSGRSYLTDCVCHAPARQLSGISQQNLAVSGALGLATSLSWLCYLSQPSHFLSVCPEPRRRNEQRDVPPDAKSRNHTSIAPGPKMRHRGTPQAPRRGHSVTLNADATDFLRMWNVIPQGA
jgi:hypothetical protein